MDTANKRVMISMKPPRIWRSNGVIISPVASQSQTLLPYLTVAFVSNQVVETVLADTAAEAQRSLDRIAFELDGMDDC